MPSPQAQLIARTMRRLNMKSLITYNSINSTWKNFHYEEPPASFRIKYPVKTYLIDRFKCVHTSSAKNGQPKCHIVYFHGGSYKMPAIRAHWHIIDSILSRANVDLTFVNYPLAPEYKCEKTITMAYNAYRYVAQNTTKDIVLMGDSAGGGLALALAQYLKKKRYKTRPKKLVLLSPWLDVSMETYVDEELSARDLLLDKNTLKVMGLRYAGDMDTRKYLCSPLFGRLRDLGEVAVFIGTNDILFSQTEELRRKMKRHNPPISYHQYDDMPHVWMGYPIPEAKAAFDEIADILKR